MTSSTEPKVDGDRHGVLDATFDTTIVLKGIDGLLETIGGILLLAVSPATLNHLVGRLTQHELSQDPHDYIARHLLQATTDLHHTRTFGAAYLLSHGIAKIVLVIALLKDKHWAYPATLIFLGAFIAYQLYRITYHPTISLAALTAFDILIVWLVQREWRQRRATW